MGYWPDFGASNERDTCLWCGKKLRAYRFASEVWAKERFGDPVPRGSYADGFFCGMRCGYLFGVRLSELGRRLQPKE